ncbi:MAG: alanine:cation symporter family protein, partial [Pirellula sp.]|nr:alanine:cation symporter family protein [Pirellula sp.]
MARVRLFGSDRSFIGWSCLLFLLSVCFIGIAGNAASTVMAQDQSTGTTSEQASPGPSDTGSDSSAQTPAAPDVASGADASSPSRAPTSAVPSEKSAVDPFTIPLPEKMPEASSKSQAVSDDWISEVDGLFGTLLVGPMEAVLFFDFGTKAAFGTSIPFVVIWLLCGGVFLTLRMSFVNLRGFFHAIQLVRGVYDKDDHKGDVSHFQALSSALSGTVGLGNIAGVAIAIGLGGPGATFWLIVAGFLGMTSKFAECTLAVMYRKTDEEGRVLGGPMVYLKEGLSRIGLGPLGSALGIVFTVLCIGGSFGGGNSFQVVQSLNALKTEPAFSFLIDDPWIYGLLMVVLVGVVIIGGIKSIGNFAGAIVPFMCVAYMAICFAVLAMNYDQIVPAV